MKAIIFFQDPAACPINILYEFGTVFQVDDVDDFFYHYGSDFPHFKKFGNVVTWVSGTDIEGASTYSSITIAPVISRDGGDGGLP